MPVIKIVQPVAKETMKEKKYDLASSKRSLAPEVSNRVVFVPDKSSLVRVNTLEKQNKDLLTHINTYEKELVNIQNEHDQELNELKRMYEEHRKFYEDEISRFKEQLENYGSKVDNYDEKKKLEHMIKEKTKELNSKKKDLVFNRLHQGKSSYSGDGKKK